MRERPGVLVHVDHRADEHVPRGGKHHHERPNPVPLPGSRIDPLAQEAVVDLGLRARLDLVPQHGDFRAGRLIGQVLVHPAAERRQGHLQLALVPQPLMDRGNRRGLQQRLDMVAVWFDLCPPDLVQLPAGQLREPALEQLGPVRLAHGRPAGGDPSCLRRRQVLPDRLAVHPKRGGHLALRAARVPVHVDLDDVDHGERSPCHPVCPSTSRFAGRGTATSPRGSGPSTRHRHAHGEPDGYARKIQQLLKPPETGNIGPVRGRSRAPSRVSVPLGNRGWVGNYVTLIMQIVGNCLTADT